ncbi:replication stress response regulator SDE2 [Carya illinoinensis]|uniref:Ubiquitin-like domain-containing protein n=1 Tax=Carya illinoinensis TaxID=32201 RepID=A0A8T1RCJ0_CARIL|nr:replication stress response regulator SDE2 [Carya illinoinensis]KAG6663681.1 hypothetical protein CIPAW_02G040300 [Carya illinoinensis]
MAMEGNNRMYHLFVKLLDGKTLTLRFASPTVSAIAIKSRLHEITRIPSCHQRLLTGVHQISDESTISCPDDGVAIFPTVNLLLRLVGGKGGFGSLLRGAATKAGQKKTNNFDACRDMSGRRLRHVNAEKKLEEWMAEEEQRKLERIAEEFIKKKAKKGKKGVGEGEAEKYVAKYREESERCVAEVLDSVNDAVKRKGGPAGGAEAKRLKIWMGKRKMAESDSDDTDEDGSDEEEEREKSVVLNNGNNSDSSKEAEGSFGSVTGGKHEDAFSGGPSCESGSEEDKETVMQGMVESGGCKVRESLHSDAVEPESNDKKNSRSTTVPCLETALVSESEALPAEKLEEATSELPNGLSAENEDGLESASADAEANSSESKSRVLEETVAGENTEEMEKPLNFDEFNTAAEMEVLGMERLKSELQARGLKCGGTLQERAARIFLLKSTPLDKLPKKLLAKK